MIEYALTELAVRDMLRSKTDLVTFLNSDTRKIDMDYQGDSKVFVNLFRSGGSPSRYLGTDNAVMAFYCYGGSRKQALDLSNHVIEVLQNTAKEVINDTYYYDCVVQNTYYSPDDNHERYIVTAVIRTRKAAKSELAVP